MVFAVFYELRIIFCINDFFKCKIIYTKYTVGIVIFNSNMYNLEMDIIKSMPFTRSV